MKNKEQRLIENMKMISVELTDKQVSQFIKFYEMLVEWNKVMNLTGITEYDEVVMKHFVDSLSIVKVNGFDNVTSIIDVGTGAAGAAERDKERFHGKTHALDWHEKGVGGAYLRTGCVRLPEQGNG